MARMHEVINELSLPGERIPDYWEPFFIAAQQKYGQRAGSRNGFSVNHWRQLNRWLNLSAEQIDAISNTAMRISSNESLYEWAVFVRYLLYDTVIFTGYSQELQPFQPRQGLPDQTKDLFLLISMLSGAMNSIQRYTSAGLDKQAENAFSLIPATLDTYEKTFHRWGFPNNGLLVRLAHSVMFAEAGYGFAYEKANLPGSVYRNSRSGELVMLALPGQLFDQQGYRLPLKEEEKLFSARATQDLLIDTDQLSSQEESPTTLSAMNQLPNGIWESKFFLTEAGGFVGNEINADGQAKASVRIFESGHWELMSKENDPVLRLYLSNFQYANRSDFRSAVNSLLQTVTFSDGVPSLIIYESWLLDASLPKYLSEDTEITDFVDLWNRYPLPKNTTDAYVEVFGENMKRKPISTWPEDTPFRKALKAMVSDGDIPTKTGGFAFLDTLKLTVNPEKSE